MGCPLPASTAKSFLYIDANNKLASTAAPTNGQLLIGSTGNIPAVASLSGTSNQVVVTPGAGSITLSTPQNIDTAAVVQFGRISSGAAANANRKDYLSGSFTGSSDTYGLQQDSSLTGTAGNIIVGVSIAPTLIEAGSGVHATEAALRITPSFTNGAATATDAVGVDINTFAVATGTTNAIGLRVAAPSAGTSNLIASFLEADGSTVVGKFYGTGRVDWPNLTAEGSTKAALCLDTSTKEMQVNTGVATCTVSSLRFKDPVRDITCSEAKRIVKAAKPGVFRDKGTTDDRYGFAAEQMAAIAPFSVYNDSVGPRAIDYERYTAVLTKYMQCTMR